MWLHLPISICSQESPCSGKASKQDADTLASRLSASVMLRGKYMPQEFWQRVCKKGALPKHLCIPMSKPSEAENSAVKWMRSLAGSHAKTSAWQASGPESKGQSRDSGLNFSASFATFDPASSSWKTSQVSLITQLLDEYSETWPRQGSMRNGVVFRRRKLGRHISAKDGSVWPTTRSSSGGGNRSGYPGAPYRPALAQVVQDETWKTPHGMAGIDHTGKLGGGGEFAKQVTQWQTPATDSFRSRGGDRVDEQGLDQQARLWATPNAHDGRRPGSDATSTQGANLKRDAEAWQTPQSRDFRSGLIEPETAAKHLGTRPLNEQVCSLQAPVTARPGQQCPPTLRPRLNPAFVCTLMGMPWYWTHPEPINSGAQEMALWRLRLDSHLSRLLKGLDF